MKKTVILICLIFTIIAINAKSYYIDEVRINAELKPNGDLLVDEEWTYNLQGGPFNQLFREIPDSHSDGLQFIEIMHDGSFLDPTNPAQCEVNDREDLEMYVTLPGYYDRQTTVNWRYLIKKPYKIIGEDVQFRWIPLPIDYDFLIKEGAVIIKKPQIESKVPVISSELIKPTISEDGQSIIYSFSNLTGEHFLTGFDLPQEVVHLPQPEFAIIEMKQAEYKNHYIILGIASVLLIFVVLFIVIALAVYRDKKLPYNSQELPEKIHPLLMWKTIFSPTSRSYNFGGAVLNLIWKKVIVIDGRSSSKLSKDYNWHIDDSVTLDNRVDEDFIHELRELQAKKSKPLIATVKLMGQNSKNPLGKALHEEFFEEGLGYEELTKALIKKATISAIFLILSIALLVPALIMYEKGMGWSFIIPILMFDTAFFALMFSAVTNTLSPEGKDVKATWKGYKQFISASFRDKSLAVDEEYVREVFPYFTILGQEKRLMKYCKKEGIEIPKLFKELNFDNLNDFYAFHGAFVATVASSGASATGAGAGAAGGGSAGAS